MKKPKLKEIKSRKFGVVVTVSIDGIYFCPRRNQQMDLAICLNRQAKGKRGCVRCRVPQQIGRKK